MTPTRLPPLTDAEYRELHAKLWQAGRVLAQGKWTPANSSVRELIEKIQGKEKQ